eukprot:TRINITY_DN10428_c0_g1_i1.p1 TRINITY_DN10428_c0_g1~~TRINITY_DN10428_c0_g1_i1.p1  ORF type:complete len:561 (+),score=147.88 TRINITY_DN10428_c0_g1_i1:105-1787(+)
MAVGNTWITRSVALRLLAAVYLFAFLNAYVQLPALCGERGILPAHRYLSRVRSSLGACVDVGNVPESERRIFSLSHFECTWEELRALLTAVPTVLWWDSTDEMVASLVLPCLVISTLMLFGYLHCSVSLALLWASYQSIANVGQLFYGYGWESQLLETGFLAIFAVPFWNVWDDMPEHKPSSVVVWLNRWLIARIMLGAGLIKVRNDQCWRDLTCLEYHYETQPIPNPLSYYLHFMPRYVHRAGVVFNHVVELVLPVPSLLPLLPLSNACGVLYVLFQLTIILSGNLSFLNWLTIVPAIYCLDDSFLAHFVPRRWSRKAELRAQAAISTPASPSPQEGAQEAKEEKRPSALERIRRVWRLLPSLALLLLVLYLSAPPVVNMLSANQSMNMSYDPLRLVNTYGAFGTVGRTRYEVSLFGSELDQPNATDASHWREYSFPCKPGAVDRAPCVTSPYHRRLDWQLWFAAMQRPNQNLWLALYIGRLLKGEPVAKTLLARGGDPFPHDPPRWIKVDHFLYRFSRPHSSDGGAEHAEGGESSTNVWWSRRRIGEYFRPLSLEDFH